MPKLAKQVVDYLNSISKSQLEKLQISNRIPIIKGTKKMFFKKTLMKRAQISMQMLNTDISSFKSMFDKVIKLGLPHPWDLNEDTISKYEFKSLVI